jgi:hypothetical protein
MRTDNTPELFTDSPAEIARIIKEARQMRGEVQDELLRSAGRGIVRLARAIVGRSSWGSTSWARLRG